MSKRGSKGWEQVREEIAAAERRARDDSRDRVERIKELLELITSGKLVSKGEEKEESIQELESEVQEYLAEQAPVVVPGGKPVLRRLAEEEKQGSWVKNELVCSLIELMELLKGEIEYLQRFKRKWEEIEAYDAMGLERLLATAWRARVGEPKVKYRRGIGLIEWELGGAGEAWWRKNLPGWSGVPYEPTCLDEVLRGGVGERRRVPGTVNPVTREAVKIDTLVDMERLEALFGMDGKRFPKKLQLHKRRVGREIVYEWRGVLEIMRALLSENEKPREHKKPGPALRIWPKPALRARVLGGLKERIKVVCVDGEIADAFLALIQESGS